MSAPNPSFDFGVYDSTKQNTASQSPGFQGDPRGEKDARGICWYGMFTSQIEQLMRAKNGLDSVEGPASDIC